MVTMIYKGVRYSYELREGEVYVFRIDEDEEALPSWLTGDLDENIECALENIDPNSIPWDSIFEEDQKE